jgi:hypothetical protein
MPTPDEKTEGHTKAHDLKGLPNAESLQRQDEAALHSIKDGYELTDINAKSVAKFLIAMGITIAVFFIFAFGMGKVMNVVLKRQDGPANQWNQQAVISPGVKGMESSPVLEQKQLQQMTQTFPMPRLQTDDGDQDMADMHAREDLLLTHYSYVDQSQGKLRIPIDRAMELIVERGLPVASQAPASTGPLMAGDARPTVQVPLTSGFARTGYEQEQRSASHQPGEQASTKANNY